MAAHAVDRGQQGGVRASAIGRDEWGHPDGGRAEVGAMRTLSLLGLDAAERPRLNAASLRRLARLGTVVRWPGLLFAAILSLAVRPISPIGLALLLIWVASYNTWG